MGATTVKIQVSGGRCFVRPPYHPGFKPGARKFWGRWDPANRMWWFNGSHEQDVRALCQTLFGTEGELVTDLWRA